MILLSFSEPKTYYIPPQDDSQSRAATAITFTVGTELIVPYLAVAELCSLNKDNHIDFSCTKHLNPLDYVVWMCIIVMLPL